MESCEPPAALNVLPWPVVSPKNRVGGSAAFSFVFAFQYIGETVDTPAENGGCGYDFASGVHKYLYAEDDPVDNVDPNGHDIADAIGIDIGLSIGLTGIPPAIGAIQAAEWAASGRPSSSALWAQYQKVDYNAINPNDNSALINFWKNIIGGTLGAKMAIPNQNGQPAETCATRLSWAMNSAGLTIPPRSQFHTWKNSDGLRYIPSAADMHGYLKSIWGRPDASILADPQNGSGRERIEGQLAPEQIAVFGCSDHIGVIKSGYKDPYVDGFDVDVWFLSPY